jgi:hypothetical protein
MRFKEKNKRNKDLKFMGKIAQKPGGGFPHWAPSFLRKSKVKTRARV